MSGFLVEVLNFFDSFCDTCLICVRRRHRDRVGSVDSHIRTINNPRTFPNPTFVRSRSPPPTVYGSYAPLVSGQGSEGNLCTHQSSINRDTRRVDRTDLEAWSILDDNFVYRPSSRRSSWSSRSRSHSRSPSLHETHVIFKGSKMASSTLSLDALLAMTPVVNDCDIVTSAARHLFLSHIKSQPCVNEVFFPTHKKGNAYESQIESSWFDFNRFACLYVSQTICKCKDEYQIHSLLMEAKIDQKMVEVHKSPHWKKLGFALYTLLFKDLVRDETTKIPFKAFLEGDRREWAMKLSERVQEKQWMYANLINPVVKGHCTDQDYNRDLNILFLKLHLLDPTTVMPIYNNFRKALPDLRLELVTTNYLGDPLDCALIRQDVEAALQKPTFPANASKLTMQELEVYYGLRVLEFIMQDAKEMGLWTGKYPDNKRMSQLRDRCSIM